MKKILFVASEAVPFIKTGGLASIGMVIALDAAEADEAIRILAEQGERASVIGRVTDTEGVVIR